MVPVDELDDLVRRRSRVTRSMVWLVAAGVAGAIAFLASRPAPEGDAGSTLPAFALPRLDRPGTFARADLDGAPVVVNFWASWCEPCREEIPLLEDAWRTYRDDGVIVLGVNVQDHADDAREFLEEMGMTFPVVRDADQELARALGLFGLPQTFFVRPDGTVVGAARTQPSASPGRGRIVLGAITRAELRDGIEEILSSSSRP